jgi:DNA-binding response OmpR family regulator
VRVLVAEDESKLAEFIARGLRRAGMAVDVAADGESAVLKASSRPYRVVVLDRNLPRLHGDDVCRRLSRARGRPRILMLTASAGVADRVVGLELGADDYLPKPFAFAELVARVRALARRTDGSSAVVLEHGNLSLDSVRRVVVRGGDLVALTRKEFQVLEALLRAEGAWITVDELHDLAWDERAEPSAAAVRNTVLRLRQKLGRPPLVESRPGAGYRIR